MKAYQVSKSALAMEEANLITITATTDPSNVDDKDEDSCRPLYVPQVFLKFAYYFKKKKNSKNYDYYYYYYLVAPHWLSIRSSITPCPGQN